MVITFAGARTLATAHMEWYHPLANGGHYAAAADGAQNATHWLVEVGDSRHIIDGDPDYVLSDAPEVLVDRATGEVTTLGYRDDPGMFATMTPVGPTMTATLPDGRGLVWTPRPPCLSGDRDLVAQVRAWLAERTRVLVTVTGPLVESTVANRLAVFTAVNAVAPDTQWDNPPTLTIG